MENWIILLIEYIIAFILLFVLDQIWVGFIAKKFYDKNISKVQNAPVRPRTKMGLVGYLVMAFGFLFFVLSRVRGKTAFEALTVGAVFGALLFGFNNVTDYTIFQNYSPELVWVDTIWGAILFTMVTFLLYRFQ
jgi:uncharacterized membrane protein